ncbi:hypothetical protein SAMN02745146_1959 [Hymenobacter daecheongensis DSM 21074]|uniref:Rubredoxin-like domain-containing protein n=2 Tax=Hymenobacter daecheongensis TaxID=496053 RepID=A0A1M6F761_9BACT|nr:hypothetical protein SAMN02745146_1959 [Hymenobacter daecheongensis DSM 21074]
MTIWHCRVCGLDYEESPWGLDDRTPDYTICECCGAEFGYDDYTPASVRRYRLNWLQSGAAWFYPKLRPADWQPEPQLAYVPEPYR